MESTRTMFQKETYAVLVMTPKPVETRAKDRDENDDCLLPHPIRRQNGLTARNKNPHRDQAINRKTRETRVKFHADSNSVKIRHVHSSLKKVVHGDKCHFRHVEAEGKVNKKSKKGGAKGSVAILKESFQVGCVSQDSDPRKSIPRELVNVGN